MANAKEQQFEAEFAEWVRRYSVPAIELKRQFPDGPVGRSFLGGAPTLPDGMEWLRDVDGLPATFVGQIDLSTLPHPPGSPLPRDGVLFFFVDMAIDMDRGGAPIAVLYAPVSRDVQERESPIPDGLAVLGDDSTHPRYICGGYTFHFQSDFGPKEPQRCILPKFRIEPRLIESVRYPRQDDCLENALYNYISEKLGDREDRFGCDISALGLPEIIGSFPTDVGTSETGWPWAWALAEFVIHKQRTYLRSKDLLPGWDGWLERAERAGPDTPMDPVDAAEFRRWLLREKYGRYMSGPGPARSLAEVFQLHTRSLKQDWELAKITMDGIAVLVDARHDRSRLIPRDVLAKCRSLLNPNFGRHQMLGESSPMQCSVFEHEHRDDVLLLQLTTDYGMLAMWAETGVLQFWISKEDLAARQFDRVMFTLEGS